MTTITASPADPVFAPTVEQPPLRRGLFGQLGVDTMYVLLGFPLGIITFVLMITGLAAGTSLLITLIGFPILVGTVYVARGFAEVERVRTVGVLRLGRVRVRYKRAPEDAGAWRRLLTPLSDPQSWLDVLHAVVRFPVAVATFCIALVWWSMALGGLTRPLWDWALPADNNDDLPQLLGFSSDSSTRITFYVVVGLIFAITLPFVVRGCALLEAWLARGLLTGVASLRDQVADLTEGRASARAQTVAAVSAETTALRRLERDIHDGPQQRLVRLSVDLGRAKQQLDADPAAARATVDEALSQAREALAELRALSRGIAPPILTDRGLPAAVASLAGRAAIPVELDLPDLPRLDAVAEQTAYFTVAEALTNVAKHSGATRALVGLRLEGAHLTIAVSDDGAGGAHIAKGHGLSGLADRLHAVGGELWISSPPQGPTIIRAELPAAPAAG
jgi:signal transduction histidine kinase